MSSRYVGRGAQNVANPTDTVCTLAGRTTSRGWIYYFCLSSAATPADNAIEWIVQRFATGAGTGTSPAGVPLDDADAVAINVFTFNHLLEPTYTSAREGFDNTINMRMTYMFNSCPGGEFVVPAAADAGWGWLPVHSAFSGLVETTIHWYE